MGKIEDNPALNAPVIKTATANFPAIGSKVYTISMTFSMVLPSAKSAPAAAAIMAKLMININIAEMKASLDWFLLSATVQPLPLINKGRTTNVGAAIVVPVSAATKRLPPGTSGTVGIKPLAIAEG